jgi:hypothetical protein
MTARASNRGNFNRDAALRDQNFPTALLYALVPENAETLAEIIGA